MREFWDNTFLFWRIEMKEVDRFEWQDHHVHTLFKCHTVRFLVTAGLFRPISPQVQSKTSLIFVYISRHLPRFRLSRHPFSNVSMEHVKLTHVAPASVDNDGHYAPLNSRISKSHYCDGRTFWIQFWSDSFFLVCRHSTQFTGQQDMSLNKSPC